MGKKILVVGALNIDFVFKAERMPKVGESIHGEDFKMLPGGKGSNQAAAIAKLKGDVQLIGRVGDDVFGKILIDNLASVGVDTGHIIKDKEKHTGTALIVVNKDGDNSIIVAGGANFNWSEEDVKSLEPILKESDYLLLQLEISLEVVETLAEMAGSYKVPVVLDAGPARKMKPEFLAKMDIVSPNETEAEALTGQEVTDLTSAVKAAHILLDMGVKDVVMKLGERGAMIVNSRTEKHIPGVKVPVVDTTAAGDAFTGALVYFLSRGLDMEEAVRYSNYVGALAVTKFGAQPSMPGVDEVREMLRRDGYDFEL